MSHARAGVASVTGLDATPVAQAALADALATCLADDAFILDT
ncbi:hypothetical protein [Amycolatopsis magusensis]